MVDQLCVYMEGIDCLMDEDFSLVKSLENQAVYSGKRLSTDIRVPGRLNRDVAFADFYREVLKADTETVQIVREGYSFPFIQMLPRHSQTLNNRSARVNNAFACQVRWSK